MNEMQGTDSDPPERGPSPGARMVGGLLIGGMIIGGLMLWLGFPLGWLWLASQISSGSSPTLAPYAVVIVGIIVSTIADYRFLIALHRRYQHVMRSSTRVRIRTAWLRSMRDDRSRAVSMSVLDVVMASTVVLALLAFCVWFFVFAHPSPGMI